MKKKPASPLIVKANLLVEAAYKLTLAEQRLLLAIVAQIDSHPDAPALRSDVGVIVTASRIADLFSVDRDAAYELLSDAVDRLAERWVVIQAPDRDEGDLVRTKTRWVSAITYLPDQGAVRLYVAPKVIPYLSHLAGEFTRYRLQYVSNMTSVYAIRLYELLVQWQNQGQREVAVDWLKEAFQIPDSYKRIGDLKRWVVDPAVTQINEHSNLWVSYGQKKAGRQVVALQFEFGLKSNRSTAPVPKRLEPPQKRPRRRTEPAPEQATLPGFERPSGLQGAAKHLEHLRQQLEAIEARNKR